MLAELLAETVYAASREALTTNAGAMRIRAAAYQRPRRTGQTSADYRARFASWSMVLRCALDERIDNAGHS